MSEHEISIETQTAQPTVARRFQSPQADLGAKFAEVLPAVYAHVVGGGGQPAGQPYARYHSQGPVMHVEAGIPIAGEGKASGDFILSELPAGEAAVMIHVGPYEKLGEAHEAVQKFVEAEGRTRAGGPYEIYLTDPGAEPDPAKWQTRVVQPLA